MQKQSNKNEDISAAGYATAIKFKQLEYRKGPTAAVGWVDGLRKYSVCMDADLFRYAFQSVIRDQGKYVPDWPDEEKVKLEQDIDNDKQLEIMMEQLI